MFRQSASRKSASERIKEFEEKQTDRKLQNSSQITPSRPKIPDKPKLSQVKSEKPSSQHPALVTQSSLTKITTNVKTVLISQKSDNQTTLTKTFTTVTRTTSNSLPPEEDYRISTTEPNKPAENSRKTSSNIVEDYFNETLLSAFIDQIAIGKIGLVW